MRLHVLVDQESGEGSLGLAFQRAVAAMDDMMAVDVLGDLIAEMQAIHDARFDAMMLALDQRSATAAAKRSSAGAH